MKKLTFEDLQPHVDMLCDALENKGASSSGIPNEAVYPFAEEYRKSLQQVRSKSISYESLMNDLEELRQRTLHAAENNQFHRVYKIVVALEIFILKEFRKYS